jgi:hypothetical protein
MKNLNHYAKDTFAFYELTLKQKHDPSMITRMDFIELDIRKSYHVYETHFKGNNLEVLSPEKKFIPLKADLLNLYSYQSRALRNLRLDIQEQQARVIRYICQHCTLTLNESLDHYVAKNDFPEFAVHPLNLLPCCNKCNQIKSSNWRKDGKRTSLNLYLDQLPKEQYLFVEIFLDSRGEIDFKYRLDNPSAIDGDLFKLLEDHYRTFKLFERIREKSVPVITELQTAIRQRLNNLNIEVILDDIIKISESFKTNFGDNYWLSILQIALAKSPIFLSSIAVI